MADPIAAATAVFEKDVGIWDAEVEIRPGPDAPVVKQKGVSTNRLLGGGRWLIVDYRADSGFEGHGIYGWDAARERYTAAWVDSAQTCIARGEGTWDPDSRTMTFLMEATHQGHSIRYREITETRPDGTQLYRNLIATPDGSEMELIRTIYRPRAGARSGS
jgi:hypothetical protein